MKSDDYFHGFHTIRPSKTDNPYVIDKISQDKYQLIGYGHCGNGQDALCFTGGKEQCINEFYERTKKLPNSARILYVLDENIRFIRIV